jgi:hypothetical protein
MPGVQNRKRIVSSTNGVRTTSVYLQKNEIDHFLKPHTKTNPKWIIVLNIQFLEENIGEKLHKSDFENDFVGMTPKT